MSGYESRTRIEHRKLLEEQGIEGFLKRIGKDVYGDDRNYIRTLSIALAHFCFREGPIEGMHGDASSGLTDARMEILNKFMVNRLGLFLMLLACEDERSLNHILAGYKMRGRHWDSPDLFGELERFGIDPDRPGLMRRLLREPDPSPEYRDYSQGFLDEAIGLRQAHRKHHPDEPLRECPHCGSEILRRDPRTKLAYYVSRSDLGCNKDVAKAAGAPVTVVSDLQKWTGEKVRDMTPKRQEHVASIARVLDTPIELLLKFHPESSTIRCDDCGASAPWHVWNSRNE